MRLRNRDDDRPHDLANPDDGGGDGEQTALRDQTAALLAAANDAIDRALSRDSTEFLAQNRQAGGQ